MTTAFTLNGTEYWMNENGYCYKFNSDKKVRIGKAEYMKAHEEAKEISLQMELDEALTEDEMIENLETESSIDAKVEEMEDAKADAEYEARADKQDADAKKTEDAFNGKKTAKKAKRKSKDIAFAVTITLADDKIADVTLTKKQVDFINALPGTSFYENGLDSTLWCDCIAQDIGWNPMGVGAMISTLREKDLVVVVRDDSRQGKPKAMNFTELGKAVAKALGLK